jgi:hypothetical protein
MQCETPESGFHKALRNLVRNPGKGFGYKVKSDGSWSTTKTGDKMQEKLIAQAKRQEQAAEAAGIQSIEWLLAEEKYLNAFQEVKEVFFDLLPIP